jgi:hypothetical protein
MSDLPTVDESHVDARPRIAAGGIFKWSGEIVAPVIAHLISQGITDFYLVLHCDHDEVEMELERSFGSRANLTIVRHNHAAFRQAAATNMLMSMAREEGFDVFIPFDADEFYLPEDETRILRDVIEEWVDSDNGEQLIVELSNFLVPGDTEFFRARTLGRMPYRVAVKPKVKKEQLNLRLLSQYKSISRMSGSPQARASFVIGGNHRTFSRGENLPLFRPDGASSPPDKICHVPFPSRHMVMNPSMAHRAHRAATTAADNPAEPKLAKDLRETTWRQTSLTKTQLAGRNLSRPYFTLVRDDTCQRILSRLIDSGFDVDDPWCRSVTPTNSSVAFVTRVYSDNLLFDAGVTAVQAQVSHVSSLYNLLDSSISELNGQPAVSDESEKLLSRTRNPVNILTTQARYKRLRQTIAQLRSELEEAQKNQMPERLARIFRAIDRLRRPGSRSSD